ncbi:MAG: hypothetical protein M3R38_32505 [Actinomycetota bacterium]|nr:hypothetical protein [Actinomycetota bacterium]
MAVFDFTDPATDAYSYAKAVSDELGDDAANAYFRELVEELLILVPGLRERFCDLLMSDLKEAVAAKEDSRYAHATIALIEDIENDWRNERG